MLPHSLPLLQALLLAPIPAHSVATSIPRPAPDTSCALPAAPEGIAHALDAAISGPADKDRSCMKALLIPEARLMFASAGADGSPTYRVMSLDDWITRIAARGHAVLTEKQVKYRIDRFGTIANLWSTYTLQTDGKETTRGINSIQAIKVPGGWKVTTIMVQAESATLPLPKQYRP